MAGPRLIEQYHAALRARLPEHLAEELADGLTETYEAHLATGLQPQAAARAAIEQFGDADTIATAFVHAAPARRAARVLLGTGPVVGGCWAAVLLTARAWTWPIPAAAALAFGTCLAAVIALLATAARCHGYQAARRAGSTALLGLMLLDLALPSAVILPGLSHGWPVLLAGTASTLRIRFTAHAWRRIHAR